LRIRLLLQDLFIYRAEHLHDSLLWDLQTVDIEVLEQLHHLADTHQLVVSLMLIESLMHTRYQGTSRVRILVEQVLQYLEMLFDEEPDSVLVFLFF
jgi:hypothetical protein